MASTEGSSRKRMKISRTEKASANASMAPIPSSSTAHKAAMARASVTPPNTACHHEQTLKTLNTDLDAMRQLITCKICDRLLYEPYALACGHTYCYSCLSQWLVDSRKKTCPDCRAVVTQQPTPSYVIRELALVFVSRSELLPDGETSEEHQKLVQEEAAIVAKDKANRDAKTGGLFRGVFARGRHRLQMPLHDPGDGVDRCPTCHWEIEDGFCEQCGVPVGEWYSDMGDSSGLSDSDEEIDQELADMENDSVNAVFGADGHDDYFGDDDFEDHGTINVPHENAWIRRHRSPSARRHGRDFTIDLISSDDEESEDDEHDPTMNDFIVNDDDDEHVVRTSSEELDIDSDATETVRESTRRSRPIVISSEADEDEEQDSEDEGPVARGSQRIKRRPVPLRQRRARTISSDEEDGNSDSEVDDHEDEGRDLRGFSPLEGSVAGETASVRSEYGSEAPSSRHQTFDGDEEEEEEESDRSDEDDGWGPVLSVYDNTECRLTSGADTRAETPPDLRQAALDMSHRLQTLGRHADRHTSAFGRRSSPAPRARPRPSRFTQSPPPYRPARQHTRERQSHRDDSNASRSFRAQPESTRNQSSRTTQPRHPFQLDNTLSSINYNQRSHQARATAGHRTSSGESSRRGGVELYSSGSSGSSTTVGAASASRRRKRQLSISSDGSVEEVCGVREYYDY